MSRLGIFLLLTIAALAQASIPAANGDQAPVKQAKPGIVCKSCEKVLMTFKKIVQNPALEADLIKTLKGLCDFPLMKPFQKKCIDKANTIVTVLEEIKGVVDDPAGLCDMMKLCKPEAAPSVSSVSKQMLLSFTAKIVQDVHPINAIDTCGLCTSALNELKRILETPEILQKVQDELESMCKYAGKYEQSCKEGIEIYFPNLVQSALDALCQPEQICSSMKLCKASLPDAFAHFRLNRLASQRRQPNFDRFLANITTMQTARGINAGCFACKAAVGGALEALNREKVLTMLTTDITNAVCKIIPAGLKAGCFDFLEIYGKAALQLTINEWTASEICIALHACNAAFLQQIDALPEIEKSAGVCDACQLLSKFLAFELEQPNFQQDIINVLTHGCEKIPGKYGNKVRCESYVKEYMPYMLENIVALSLVPHLCSTARLC